MHLGIAIHEAGGARMGEDRRRSVTDPRNRVWDCPNVFVTDGACLPSTGCQNPTLTIMALTARACALAVGGEPPTPQS
jgi:choline dehydrogenase-like flavoprotein